MADRNKDEGKKESRSDQGAQISAGLEEMERTLERKSQEAEEANRKYLRTYADFENYRKRTQRDMADFRRYANEQMARELLSVIDHLALAIRHARGSSGADEGFRRGVELVHRQLLEALAKFGIIPFSPAGEPFDPARDEAVMQEIREDLPDHTVSEVLQDGYLYHDKVLRHARVSVSKKPAEKEENEDQEAA